MPDEVRRPAELKRYLGDAVYVEVERGMLKLTTEDGIAATNTIYLEPAVMQALIAYWDELTGAEADRG